MLNRLISLVFLLLILNSNLVYSETNFLLPLKKPSIFKQTNKEISGEFLGRLVLGVEDDLVIVFGATIYYIIINNQIIKLLFDK